MNYENKEQRRQERKRRKRLRKKRIFQLILSILFISTVFFVVIHAAYENIITEKAEEEIIDENPTLSNSSLYKEDFLTILIAVTDEDEIRTDSLVVVSFDNANNEVSLLNIPRDTYTNATKENKKITSAYVSGIDHTLDVVADTIGFRPQKYVVCNLDELLEITEVIGGITVDVPMDMDYDDPTQDLHIHIEQGEQTLYGLDLINYLRFRKNNDGTGYSDGDLGRINTFNTFVETAKDQIITFENIAKLPEIANIVFSNVTTDMKFTEIVWVFKNIIDGDTINSEMLPGEIYYSYYKPIEDEILELVNEKYNPFVEDITELNLYDG